MRNTMGLFYTYGISKPHAEDVSPYIFDFAFAGNFLSLCHIIYISAVMISLKFQSIIKSVGRLYFY